jgi:uncharacterized protein
MSMTNENHAAVTQNIALLQRMIDAINQRDFLTMREILHPDISFELPFIFGSYPKKIVGLDAVMTFLEGLADFYEEENLSDVTLHAFADDPSELAGEFVSDMQLKSRVEYRNEYVVRATVRDEKIIVFREYLDPIRLLVALGGSISEPASRGR